MLPPEPKSPAEVWVAHAKRAACQDLIARLQALSDLFRPIYLLADWQEDQEQLEQPGVELLPRVEGDFHFGEVLASIIEEKKLARLAYFGGASAPLLTSDTLESFYRRMPEDGRAFGLVNNYHSTDWGIFTLADRIVDVRARLPTDNPLGWVLHHEAEYEIQGCPAEGFSRADIDTPADILMLRGHTKLGFHLGRYLEGVPEILLHNVAGVQEVLGTPASTLALIGRASPSAQLELQNNTQIWVRAFIEERGMVASHRLEHGEVRSLIGAMIETWGPEYFIDQLVSICDGALWDTRVWMAHAGRWPSTADRFAADLGWIDQISDKRLNRLAAAVHEAPIPVISGGYGVVAGGLYAMLETMAAGGDYQPSK
jgi:hypothetical protein